MTISTPFCLSTPIKTHTKLYNDEQPFNIQSKTFQQWVHYFNDDNISRQEKTAQAKHYLDDLIKTIDPASLSQMSWLNDSSSVKRYFEQQHQRTGKEFQHYLQQRQSHAPRRYFKTISHAFEFLYKVAPVKYVDGAWLYSCVHHPQRRLMQDLIFIYLEELGLGDPAANHVRMYQQLLQQFELETYTERLSDAYYEQAAVQMALAYAPEEYMALVIGFNLAYEQLPLHLLITHYELKELGIDPQYFTVHITIDNAHQGHAFRSIRAFKHNLHQAQDREKFLNLVKYGFIMNDLGLSSTDIIQTLDTSEHVLQVMQAKATVGQYLHNDKCQFSGKTINQWLSNTDQVQNFLNILIEKQWIILDQPVEHSRFWQMIDQPQGRMFGVFSRTEKQFIRDWIEGNLAQSKLHPSVQSTQNISLGDLDSEIQIQAVKEKLSSIKHPLEQLQSLVPYLAPHRHHQDVGLWATQRYSQVLFPFHTQP